MPSTNSDEHEHLAWARILENIAMMVKPEKLEKSTRGEWRSGLLRCVNALLRCQGSSGMRISSPSNSWRYAAPPVLHVLSRTIYRLLACCTVEGSLGADAIETTLSRLEEWEQLTSGPTYIPIPYASRGAVKPLSLHSYHDLFLEADEDKTRMWGDIVENLWKASLLSTVNASTWKRLTSRVLVWRTISSSTAAEWAGREAIDCGSVLV
jgi:nucleolar pre-ribosomal-associated protein 1